MKQKVYMSPTGELFLIREGMPRYWTWIYKSEKQIFHLQKGTDAQSARHEWALMFLGFKCLGEL